VTDWRHTRGAREPYEQRSTAPSTGEVAIVQARCRRLTIVGVGDADGVFVMGVGREDLLGWSSDELRCAPYGEWVHPDDREALIEEAQRVVMVADGTFWPVEVRILARDRRYWWTRWHLWMSAVRCAVCASGVDYVDPDGVVGALVGTWRWHLDTDHVVCSPELLDMFAFGVGTPASYEQILDAVHHEDRAELERAVRWSLRSGEPFVADFRGVENGERERWFHAAGRFEPHAGGRVGQLCGVVKFLNP
jgi:PAS fold